MLHSSDRSIGKLVSLDTFSCIVELHTDIKSFCVSGYDDIHYFGQINSYVLIPQKNNFIVGEVVGLQESSDWSQKDNRALSASNVKKGPSPSTFVKVVLIGTLQKYKTEYTYKSGVSVYPSLFSDVLYLTQTELDIIFGVNDAEIAAIDGATDGSTALKALSIGKSVIFHDYEVKIDVDSFFGSHTAVLGNTGSGKSCTISSVLQQLYSKQSNSATGSTFVILDVNGEYISALSELAPNNAEIRVKYFSFATAPYAEKYTNVDKEPFVLPHWLLDMEEWRLLLQASDKTQLPVLRNALRFARLFSEVGQSDKLVKVKNSILARCVQTFLAGQESAAAKLDRLKVILGAFRTDELNVELLTTLQVTVSYGALNNQESLLSEVAKYLLEKEEIPITEEGTKYSFDSLGEALQLAILYEESHGNNQIRNHCAPLLTRFDNLNVRPEFKFLKPDRDPKRDEYLANFLGINSVQGGITKSHQIIILDMNSIEDELVEVVSSVIARLVFQQLQRTEPRNAIPINLILEEAHRYVPVENLYFPANKIFERIAKEGRKYGLFLLISSQRPSEISRTVLSQCSNFVIHRILNPEDLSYIRHMTPHVSEQILNRLPYLPSQHALVFGHAVRIPCTVRINNALPLPRSDNNEVSKNWFVGKDVVKATKMFSDPPTGGKNSSKLRKLNSASG